MANIVRRVLAFVGIRTTGYRPESVTQEISLGLIVGVEYVLWAYSFASIVFIGALSNFLPVGVVTVLAGSALVGLFVALTSSAPVHSAAADEQAAAILASIAIIMNGRLDDFAGPNAAAATMLVICGLVTVGFGICLHLIVKLKGDVLLQLIPFPVVCGFLGGLGWLMFDAALNITADVGVYDVMEWIKLDSLIHWVPSFLAGLAIYITINLYDHPLVLPVSRVVCFAGFYFVAFAFGASMETLQDDGWLFKLGGTDSIMGYGDLDFAGVDFGFILSVLPQMATIILLVLLSAIFNLSGLEVGTRTNLPLRAELRGLANANVASGLAMGLPGLTDIVVNITAHNAGVRSRIFPILAASVCLAAILFGGGIIAYLPKFLIATVIFYSAIQFAYEWMIVTCRNMPRSEALVTWSIFAVIAAVGFIPGILFGILLSSVMFIVRYSNIDIVDSSFSLNEIGSSVDRSQPEVRVLNVRGKEAKVFNLRGFLFFGTANQFFEHAKTIAEDEERYSYFVFNFARVTGIDSTAVQVFIKIVNYLSTTTIRPIFCGMPESIHRLFLRTEGFNENEVLVLEELDLALKWAEEALLDEGNLASDATMIEDILGEIFEDREKGRSLARIMKRCAFPKGTYLFRQGDPGTSFFIIESGMVEVRLEPTDGKIIRLREFRRGTAIGEMAAYSKSKSRTASALAIEPTVAYELAPDAIAQLGADAPAYRAIVHEFVARLLTARLTFMNKRFENQISH